MQGARSAATETYQVDRRGSEQRATQQAGFAAVFQQPVRERGHRFFFFSREEPRMHVHIYCEDDEAKYWLGPSIMLAKSYNLSKRQLAEIERIIEAHCDELTDAWKEHFGG